METKIKDNSIKKLYIAENLKKIAILSQQDMNKTLFLKK